MLTAYDFPLAKILDTTDIDAILVGDSVGNVMLGYENTLPVTMEEMLHHTKAVCRAVEKAYVIFDMPFLSYQISEEEAKRNAGAAIKTTSCSAVKLEGGRETTHIVASFTRIGIPVMGHIGLTPQSLHQIGGYKIRGKEYESARKLVEDALALEQAGAFSIVLECVPWKLAEYITQKLSIPTIGIGSGPFCDGQVLVLHDMLGLLGPKKTKFVKQYLDGQKIITEAVQNFIEDVKFNRFPTNEHSFEVDESVITSIITDIQ